VKLNEKTPEFT